MEEEEVQAITLAIEAEGFDVPLIARLSFEAFEDPIYALKKLRLFEDPFFCKVRFEGMKEGLEVRTKPTALAPDSTTRR